MDRHRQINHCPLRNVQDLQRALVGKECQIEECKFKVKRQHIMLEKAAREQKAKKTTHYFSKTKH